MELQRILIQILILLAVSYSIICIYVYFFQAKLLYFPTVQNFNNCPSLEDYQKITINKTRFYYKRQGENTVVFYHGNAGSACDRGYHRDLLEAEGKSVIIAEYQGYSNDSKTPSKNGILEDVRTIFSFIEKEKLILYAIIGESIGASVASYHASLQPPKSLS